MRLELQAIDGQRLRFRGVVERFGEKRGWKGCVEQTLLLKNLCRVDNEQLVADHIWFTVGKRIASICLYNGDIVEFDARVSDYVKGYVNWREGVDERRLDYKLSYLTKLAKVGSTNPNPSFTPPEQPVPDIPKGPSSFKTGDLAILTHAGHTHEGQVCKISRALNNKFVEVVFADGYKATTCDRHLSGQRDV